MQNLLIILGLIIIFVGVIWFLISKFILRRLKEFADYRYEFIYPNRKILEAKEKDAEKQLKHMARSYAKSDVEHIVLIHGTFAGDDPLLLNRALAKRTPRFLSPVYFFYRKIAKKSFDVIGKDLGNFTKVHKQLLEKSFKQKISLFNWSGNNSHYGRLSAVIEFIDFLNVENNKNVLIIAHSHGGQLLALMTQLFWDKSIMKALLKEELISEETIKHIKRLRNLKYTLVTMGTPVRYQWRPSTNIKILHFINHRGKIPTGGSVIGGLWNRKGDYVQQFGGTGSDNISIIDIHSKTNKKLALIFKEDDPGFLGLLKRRQRLHHQGFNLLVDYQDAKFYPNFYKTMFGHGIYTRYHLLAFHLKKILKHLV